MATNKKNIFETLTLKSFDAFIKLIDDFDFNFSYIHSSNMKTYLKGRNKLENLQKIAGNNADFKEIFEIKEKLSKLSDRRSTKFINLKDELDSIRLTLE